VCIERSEILCITSWPERNQVHQQLILPFLLLLLLPQVLDPSWFRGADVLDVGCNEGLLTLALAVGCCCRSMTGVDIDPALVAKACTNLSRTRSELTQQMQAAVAAR
jgi:ribosomal protein L11 methylase PrmA